MTSRPGHSPTRQRALTAPPAAAPGHDEGPPSREPICQDLTSKESLRPASAGGSGVVSHLALGVLAGLEDDGHSQGNAGGRQAAAAARGRRPPTSNTGVVNPTGRYGWDWSATTHDARETVVHDLLHALGTRVALPGNGLQGWRQSVKAFDGDGHALGSVYFGGRDDVHLISTSSAADAARRAVVGLDRARTSRVDTRVDTLASFEDLREVCEAAAGMKARVTYMESRQGGESTGRTVYVGSPTSAVRVRLYEKWLESPGQYVEGTNRVEVQLRPPSRAKEMVSAWTPAETFCASQLTRRVADALGSEVAEPGSLEKHRGTPDLEQTLQAMGTQYGKAVDRWLQVSGGDLDRVLDYLMREGA